MSKDELLRLKIAKAKALEEKLRLKDGLPHLYGLPKYKWQDEYCKAKFTHEKRFICAANQIGKSTIQIRDRIDVATNPKLWPILWPNIFKFKPYTVPYSWYLYPNQDTVFSEFLDKWVPDILPRGEFKNHPLYGWKEKVQNKVLKRIDFNSGYKIYFKTYNQNVHDLQSGTVFGVDCDEELPEGLLSELEARLFATSGQFSMAFTATLGQDIWYKTIERQNEIDEIFPDAWKAQVSMYDCLEYLDGSSTPWTKDRIGKIILKMKSKAEVQRRIYGRFVKDTGLKYPGFDRERNLHPYPRGKNGNEFKGVPKGWSIYTAADYGSGGDSGHPSAYSFLSLSPCLTKIRVFKKRRLDGIQTTAGDLYTAYKKARGKLQPVVQVYDWSAKDFGTIASRAGDSFERANKSHDEGELALNTALKLGMLVVYNDDEGEGEKLAREFESLREDTPKRVAKDDLIDTIRYALLAMPIDWELVFNEGISNEQVKPEPVEGSQEQARPNDYWSNQKDKEENESHYEEEFTFWSDQYGDL